MLQAKEVGTAYWACRSCLNFAAKMNRHLQETNKRQDQLEERVNVNTSNISKNEKGIEELRQELRRALAKMDSDKEARDDMLCDELREREIRRLNIIIHGMQEPDNSIQNNSERIEADRRMCGDLFAAIGVRVRGSDLRFCRRVGERGPAPRPIVVGLNSEDEKRVILARSKQLRGGRYDNVAVVPDLTKMQRRGEDKLGAEADVRNRNLTVEDRERGLRWLVVGKRGEKRLIKGVEREPQRDRSQPTLYQYLPRIGGGGIGGTSGNNYNGGGNNYSGGNSNNYNYNGGNSSNFQGANLGARSRVNTHYSGGGNGTAAAGNLQGADLGARIRDNAPNTGGRGRLLSPVRADGGGYVPIQHSSQPQQQQQQAGNAYGGRGNGYSETGEPSSGYNTGGAYGGRGNGYGETGGPSGGYNTRGAYGGRGNGYGENGGPNRGYNNNTGYVNGHQDAYYSQNSHNSGYGQNAGRPEQYDNILTVENRQHAETDRQETTQSGMAEPVVPQPGTQRQRLGSKRGRDGASNIGSELSPPRTRQRQ
jgi:hypothetical protein